MDVVADTAEAAALRAALADIDDLLQRAARLSALIRADTSTVEDDG